MQIIGAKKITDTYAKHHQWKTSLERWHALTKAAAWKTFQDVRQTFPSADSVGSCVVFNVGGNKCRLIAYVNYQMQRVTVSEVLSHTDYDKGAWKNACCS